ncbi:alcohol dehydrogenase 1-like isoform X2 [Hyla sarda]|uniref:alcohol dehydrogenase 1-like isoform X2 n=1 Tax=Hyla sarda TaxID=327740 RepID=UPI0024C38347|nr:alcohol dehydrogenase 1-like isoform X2 [Hyla sarda]
MSTAGKVIKCRAAVAYDFKKPFVVEEIEVAPPKAHEIRVKVCASGICHTDDHALGGGMASLNFPVVLGHEGAGVVESVGEGVFKVQPGDHVILLCSPMCMKCKACLHEESNFCEKNDVGKNVGLMLDKTTRFSIKGKMIHNFMSTSTFTEYTVVDEFAICRIDKAAPFDQVCLVGCGFSTGFGTVLNTAKVKPGSTCVVFGLGGIGMSAVMACKIAGATKIIGVDINPTKFNKAKELGCTECVNPDDHSKPIHEVITEMTDGGADYGFECIGKVDVMASMIQSTNYSFGSACIIGVPKSTDRISLDVMWLLTGRKVQGAFLGDYKAPLDFPGIVSDMLAGKIDLDPLVSWRLPLEKINEGFDLMRNGKTIRTVLMMPKK